MHFASTARNILFNVKTVAEEVDEMLKDVNINEKQMDKICEEVKGEASEMRNYLKEKDKYGNNIMFGKYKEIRTTIK